MATAPKKASSTVRVPMQSVTVHRNGKSVTPDIGKPFEFTAEELEQIEAANPAAVSTQGTVDVSQQKADDI